MKPQKNEVGDLWPGQSVALLKALHILTHNGGLNADSRRKLKQVQHLAQLIKPAIDAALADKDQPVLADLGAGKSYLGFILYDLYFAPAKRGRVVAVEARTELIETAKTVFLAHRPSDTPVIIAGNLGRPEERVRIVPLSTFDPEEIDMLTIVVIGSSTSKAFSRGDGRTVAFTPRGYARKVPLP